MSREIFSEDIVIDFLKKRIPRQKGVYRGIGDDAAVMNFDNKNYLLYTCDMIVEGTHFKKNTNPEMIGHKALAVSLSDIAAMGGVAKYATISLGIPRDTGIKFIESFYKGLIKLARRFKVAIVGGDTVRSDKIVADTSVVGLVERKNLKLRSGARYKDLIFVTGALGGSLANRHLTFLPRIKEARYLVNNFMINSMMDLSDGLSQDLVKLVTASNCGALIIKDKMPVSKDAKNIDEALYMGEDFELLFTMPKKDGLKLLKTGNGIFSCIGEIKKKEFGVKIQEKDGVIMPFRKKGFKHF